MLLLTETFVLFLYPENKCFHAKYYYMLFCLFYVTGVEKWNLLVFQIMILEHLHFCLVNHACMSHLLCGQPHLLECYYQNCLIRTCMCVHPVSEWSVFLPFNVNCSQVAMFQIMAALCVHREGEGRGGGWSPNVDRLGQGEEGPKNSQVCADILYGWPLP